METRKARLGELAELIGRKFVGNNILINGLGLSNRKTQFTSILSYITSEKYIHNALSNDAVKALVVNKVIYQLIKNQADEYSYIISDNPEDDFYTIHHRLIKETNFYEKLSFSPVIGSNCNIHRSAVIEDGVVIGDNVTIGPNSVVNRGVTIGDNTHIGCCSVIGSEGFQILRNKYNVPYNVLHVGGTIIGKNVWVGDNVTVCNSIFEGAVTIGDNCQIDNHSYIAHNCTLGKGNVVTAGVLILGSVEIKNDCWIAPGSVILNKVVIENDAFVGANSLVNSDVKKGMTVFGSPALLKDDFVKIRTELKKIIN